MKTIIGLVGRIGSGKDTVAHYLIKNRGFRVIGLGDLVRAKAKRREIEPTRKNISKISKEFSDKFGIEFWSRQAITKLKGLNGENFIINGLRRLEDYNNVKSTFKNFKFILVDAKSKTRYSRIRKRDRVGDPTSYKAFRDQEKNELKLYKNFDETLKQVDFVIDNNSTLEDLYKNVDSIISKV